MWYTWKQTEFEPNYVLETKEKESHLTFIKHLLYAKQGDRIFIFIFFLYEYNSLMR